MVAHCFLSACLLPISVLLLSNARQVMYVLWGSIKLIVIIIDIICTRQQKYRGETIYWRQLHALYLWTCPHENFSWELIRLMRIHEIFMRIVTSLPYLQIIWMNEVLKYGDLLNRKFIYQCELLTWNRSTNFAETSNQCNVFEMNCKYRNTCFMRC